MGYLFLSISLISGNIKGYCGKKTGGLVQRLSDALLFSLIRMVLCILISLLVLCIGGNFSAVRPNGYILFITAVSGITTSVFVTAWLLSVRKGAYMMVNIFLMLGVFVTILCSFSLGETVSWKQLIGIGLLLTAVVFMCNYQKVAKGKLSKAAILLLIVCGTANGLTDFSQKLFVRKISGASVAVFQLYTYLFSALVLAVFFLLARVWERKKNPVVQDTSDTPQKHPSVSIAVFLIVMAICLYLNSYFKTQSAFYLTASQLYPLYQGGDLILGTLMAALFFKEKPNRNSIIGIAVAFLALLLINL